MVVVLSFMVVVAVELVGEFDPCDEERVGKLLVLINEEGNDADAKADDDKGRSRLRRWCSVMVAIGCGWGE
jgi:hypothetical protein